MRSYLDNDELFLRDLIVLTGPIRDVSKLRDLRGINFLQLRGQMQARNAFITRFGNET